MVELPSLLGYLKVHSFSYQASRAHTVQLFVSTHQCIPLIPLPLDENQLVAWERLLNFSPVLSQPVRRKRGREKKVFSARVYSLIAFDTADKSAYYWLLIYCMLRFLSQTLNCVRVIIASPSPHCLKMTSCFSQDREVLSCISQCQRWACEKAAFLPVLSFVFQPSFFKPPDANMPAGDRSGRGTQMFYWS